MTTPINPNDNLGVIQKKSDHWTVAGTLSAIIIVNCIGFIFPNYHASYSNIVFDIVNVLLVIGYVYFAYKLWATTFEEYTGSMLLLVILSTLACLLWVLCWGGGVETKALNGFK